jgi:hypothetical protein
LEENEEKELYTKHNMHEYIKSKQRAVKVQLI